MREKEEIFKAIEKTLKSGKLRAEDVHQVFLWAFLDVFVDMRDVFLVMLNMAAVEESAEDESAESES